MQDTHIHVTGMLNDTSSGIYIILITSHWK